jgi:hypothetical protein
MAYIPNLGGMDGNFAPADFEDDQPTGVVFDVGGHGQDAPYSLAMNSILHKQLEEVKSKSKTASLSATWKRRLRDFMAKKNNDLLDFLKVTVPHHPVFGPGEILLKRFGNPQVTPNHVSVRDMVFEMPDISGEETINAFLAAAGGETPLKDYTAQTLVIYDMYKEAGDMALKLQQVLKIKLDRLDRIQGKISGLFDIECNEKYEPLMKANEEYLEKIFKDSDIEEDYKALLAAYRRFITLREVISSSRAVLAQESEPLCSICLEESVEYTLNPCGHTFCKNCIMRQNGNCFICRANIKEKLRLYFG